MNEWSGAEYRITTTWDNQTIDHPNSPIVITLDRNDADTFKITVHGPYFADPPGPVTEESVGEPFYGLWDYEGSWLFPLNKNMRLFKLNKVMTYIW